MITLRDQFAMAAMQGEISSQCFQTGDQWNLEKNHCRESLAERSYQIADAMLAEREKNEAVKDRAEATQ